MCSCKRNPWWGACHYSVKLLLAASFGSQNALLLSWSSRERKREREKVKENNCHSRFIEILVLQCVTAVILTHSTYHFVSGLCSRSHIPFAVMAHSRTTQRLLKIVAGLPWQWLPYTLSLNFSEQTRDIHHSFYFFLSKQFCVCLCHACGQVKLSSFPAILCFLSLCLAVFSFLSVWSSHAELTVCIYRLDTTLIDFTDMKCQRGDLSFIFNGNAIPSESFVVLDNEQKVYQRIHHEVCETHADKWLRD